MTLVWLNRPIISNLGTAPLCFSIALFSDACILELWPMYFYTYFYFGFKGGMLGLIL